MNPARNLAPQLRSVGRYESVADEQLDQRMESIKRKLRQKNSAIELAFSETGAGAEGAGGLNESQLNCTMRAVQQDCEALLEQQEQQDCELESLRAQVDALETAQNGVSREIARGVEVVGRELKRLAGGVSCASSALRLLEGHGEERAEQQAARLVQCFVSYAQMSAQQIRLQENYANNINESIRITEEQMLGEIQEELASMGAKLCDKENDIKKLYARIQGLQEALDASRARETQKSKLLAQLEARIKEERAQAESERKEANEKLEAVNYERKHLYEQLELQSGEREHARAELAQLRDQCERQHGQLQETLSLNQRLNQSLVDFEQQNRLL